MNDSIEILIFNFFSSLHWTDSIAHYMFLGKRSFFVFRKEIRLMYILLFEKRDILNTFGVIQFFVKKNVINFWSARLKLVCGLFFETWLWSLLLWLTPSLIQYTKFYFGVHKFNKGLLVNKIDCKKKVRNKENDLNWLSLKLFFICSLKRIIPWIIWTLGT